MPGHNHHPLTDSVYYTLKRNALSRDGGDIVILESQLPSHPESKSTYVAAYPRRKLIVKGAAVEWHEDGEIRKIKGDPWGTFRKFRKQSGWLFGYIGYDMKNHIDTLTSANNTLVDAPDLYMIEPSLLFKIEDNLVKQITGEPVKIETTRDAGERGRCEISIIKRAIRKKEYTDAIQKIKHLIKEGDFYELNYSYPFTAKFSGDSYELYRKMREINPVPFGSYIETGNLRICCSSPERFLKNSDGNLMSEPIKGTAGRSANSAEDDRLRNELKNPKNEAENLMIVDLVRHDLSRVSTPGTIRVSKLYDIQTFGTVHQLISRVEGRMKPGTDPVDAIKACFPMGSMTGAPKLRVMNRIEEIENYRRGVYSGSIGYITPQGNFDFNVVIRTAILQESRLVYPVGGAITGDSDPNEEWHETEVKARVLTNLQGQ